MNSIQEAILKTVSYSDVFNYPLTKRQLHKFLISNKKVEQKNISQNIFELRSILSMDKYVHFKKRGNLISIRKQREVYSRQKIKEASRIAHLLSSIPTVLCICLSGSLAMRNSKENDDIDFFIITKPNTLWISRFLVLALLFILGKKRKPKNLYASSKICANMFMSADQLELPQTKQNLFSAHEVIQTKPLLNKKRTYEQFLFHNKWVLRYMANSRIQKIPQALFTSPSVLKFVDGLFYKIQHWYMAQKITDETVQKNLAMFHPFDYKTQTLHLYKTKYGQYQNATPTRSKSGKKKAIKAASENIYLASIFTPGS